jgi:hypothetical protein
MAKVTGPLFSLGATGTVGGSITFDKRGWVREHVIPNNRQTAPQMSVRRKLGNVQRVDKMVGAALNATLTAALGYRWASQVVGEVMGNHAAKYDAYYTEATAFAGDDLAAWTAADPAIGQLAPAGVIPGNDPDLKPWCIFYAVAKAAYDVALRVSGDAPYALPISTNGATIGAAWVA